MEEKAKLRDELARAKKNVSELEAAKENQEESIGKIEEVLRETRNKLTILEQRLEDSKRDNADLHEEVEEVNRKLKYAKEGNSELEKTLQKQKDISDGLRNNLVERDESVMTSNYNRDVAERSLQALKKDLATKDAKLKMQKEQTEDMEGEAEKADKKIKETESSSKKLASENERLSKELADINAKLEKAEKGKVVGKSEVPVVRVSEVQATSVGGADQLIRDWSDKLSTAQTKVTDLETELLKDIKKHEARVHRTRPVPPELRRKSADYVLTDHERQSRFRSRQRPNLSRDSSLDSLRSTQSMLDYLDDRIVDENLLSAVASSGQGIVSVVDKNFTVLGNDTPAASETVTPTPSEPSTPVTAGYGSPVDSESEGPYDVPRRKTARAKSLNASTESIREAKERDVMKKQEILGKEGSQSNGQEEENLVDWKKPKVKELDINDKQPLLPEASTNLPDETTSSSKADDLVNSRGKEPYIHPLPTEKPQRIDGTTENASDTQNNPQLPPPDDSRPGTEMPSGEVEDLQTATTPDLHMIFQKEISKTERNDEKKEEESQNICFKPNSTNNLQGENRFDEMRIEEARELQSETSQLSFLKQRAGDSQNDFQEASPSVQTDSNFHLKTKEMTEIKSDYGQPVLIQPPSEDLFQFVNLPTDNSAALVSFGEDPKPTLLNENHTFMADFDSLDIPEPQPYNMGGREILDPFEQLMRDAQRSDLDDIAPNEAESKNIDTDLSTILIFDLQQTVGRNNEDPSKGELMENCLDDVTIDVTDDATCDDVVIDRQQTAGRNNEPRRYISNYPISDEEKGDVIHPPKQFVSVSSTDDYHDDVFNFRKSHEPVPYSVRVANGTYRDRDVDKPMEEAESIFLKDGYSDGVADFTIPLESVPPLRSVTYSDINKPQQETQAKFIPDGSNEEVADFTKPLEPIPPPRKLKEKMKPVLFPRREKKKDNEKDRKTNTPCRILRRERWTRDYFIKSVGNVAF
ncbi:uncharacterized protein [Montipora foliosa]|uniref:uncharacterized protein n=1 Tax=Montipora foliosa TaxID=591990 RepID=UPI0035F1CD73